MRIFQKIKDAIKVEPNKTTGELYAEKGSDINETYEKITAVYCPKCEQREAAPSNAIVGSIFCLDCEKHKDKVSENPSYVRLMEESLIKFTKEHSCCMICGLIFKKGEHDEICPICINVFDNNNNNTPDESKLIYLKSKATKILKEVEEQENKITVDRL